MLPTMLATTDPLVLPPLPGFRAVPLDGAMLYFHPATGTHVRIANQATAGFRRAAPRVAMFGITNACNLDCAFCSRDRRRPSRWTAASAAEVLRGLAAAGTLEVAFGGGEPFVFPGFRDLLAELRATTPLALHVTTNGTRIDATAWPAFTGLLDMVRLSLYDEAVWRAAAAVLTAARQRWGANVLVDDAAVARLPELLAELAAVGCADVSILTFVGADPARQLSATGRARLATVLADSPLPARLSVCAGSSIPVATLQHGFAGMADCGAGLDFVSITPDQGMLACSFQDGPALPARSAAEILDGWRTRRDRLAQASTRHGCARAKPARAPAVQPPPIAIWRSYSGNNSGECVMVATFATVEEAEKHLAELLPGWHAAVEQSPEWTALFAREQVAAPFASDEYCACEQPHELLALGRSVLAVGYAADDIFAPLRALAWKRDARVSNGGIHVHDPLSVLAAIRCRDSADAHELAARCAGGVLGIRAWPHGATLLVIVDPMKDSYCAETQALAFIKARLTALADERPFAVEVLLEKADDDALLAVKKRLTGGPPPPTHGRLCASFWRRDEGGRQLALAFARSLGTQPTVVVGSSVFIDPVERPKRLAVLAYRRGATVTVLDEPEVMLNAHLWYETEPRRGAKAKAIPLDAVKALFTSALPASQVEVTAGRNSDSGQVDLRTTDPGPIMHVLEDHARSIGCQLSIRLSEADALAAAVRRVMADCMR